ncbi:hypothetical protein FQR65_LT08581 [Abscondita terminalis]|nr:hypothetical protein FQR65_LT08581 [Abscondita terminalis]
MRMSYNNTLHWSICVPSTCTSTDVQKFLSKLFNSIITYKKADVQVSSLNCYTDKYVPFDTSEIVYCSVIALFSSFVLVATIYDIVYRKLGTRVGTEEKLCHKIIISFSSIENVKKLLKYTPSSDTNLEFVFGIKVISMILIIGSHTLLFVVGGPVFNEDFYIESVTKPENAFLLNNPLFVDTFLLISGFLMSRLLLLELNKKAGNVNIFMLYVARYIRLTPAYAVMIGLYATILKRLGNGPLWNNKILIEYNRCVQSWWTNILYINNYVNDDNICMFQSWYLSVDTHLFLIAPLIIYPLWRWPRVGKVLLSLFTFTFGLIPFVITYRYKLDPTQMAYPSEILDIAKNYYFRFAYIKTHMRSLSYSIGLVMGYVVDQLQSSKTQLSKTLTYTSLTVCVTFGISAVYSITIFYLPNYTYDELESALYASLHKIAWSLCVGCIIVLCATNNLGTLKSFLSWPPFVPFSRLTYCAYLVNGVIELYSLGTLRSPTYLSIWSLVCTSTSFTIFTNLFFSYLLR